MKKYFVVLFFFGLFNCKAQKDIVVLDSSHNFGALHIMIINPINKKAYSLLDGRLFIDEETPLNVSTDINGRISIKPITVGKHTFTFKTDKCCVFKMTDVQVLKDKTGWLKWAIPTKQNLNDTCVVTEKYRVETINIAPDRNGVDRSEFYKKP